jgi:hypothetical protein
MMLPSSGQHAEPLQLSNDPSKARRGILFEDELLIHIQHLFTELTQAQKTEQN